MKIFDRLQSGLFNPGRIPNYEKDSKLFTSLYFILLVVLIMIPTVISVLLADNLNYKSEVAIRKEFMTSEVVPYEIIDGTLVFKDDIVSSNQTYHTVYYSDWVFYFSVDSNFTVPIENLYKTNILLFKDGIYRCTPLNVSLIMKYSDYEQFDGLDFSLAINYDKEFYNQFYLLVENIIEDHRVEFVKENILMIFLKAVLTVSMGSLILTIFGRFGENNYFKFSKHWQLMVYAMTPLVVGSLLSTLFSMNLLYYIGLFMTLIYSFGINQNPNRGGKKNEF